MGPSPVESKKSVRISTFIPHSTFLIPNLSFSSATQNLYDWTVTNEEIGDARKQTVLMFYTWIGSALVGQTEKVIRGGVEKQGQFNQQVQGDLPLSVFILWQRVLPNVQTLRQFMLSHIHVLAQIPETQIITPLRGYYMLSQNVIFTKISFCDIFNLWYWNRKGGGVRSMSLR